MKQAAWEQGTVGKDFLEYRNSLRKVQNFLFPSQLTLGDSKLTLKQKSYQRAIQQKQKPDKTLNEDHQYKPETHKHRGPKPEQLEKACIISFANVTPGPCISQLRM